MKKLMVCTLIIAAGFSARAQKMFGVQAGANFASIHSNKGNAANFFDLYQHSKTVTRITAGVVANINFRNDAFSFRPEINFIQNGENYTLR